jgi:hypothetical protein
MLKYFDKSFFKIIGGFVAILCLSLMVFLIAAYLQAHQGSTGNNPNGLEAGTTGSAENSN